MSYSYERFDSRQRRQGYGSSSRRSTLGYWVPLAVTITAATIGLAAWIWKERGDEEEYDRRDDRRSRREERDSRPPPGYNDMGPDKSPYPPEVQSIPPEDPGIMARMQGALRRTPSPQQFFNEAGRHVSAGMAAAGAAVTGAMGGALGSIREEDRVAYEDHSRWSEEAAVRAGGNIAAGSSSAFGGGAPQLPASARSGDRRKTVAIVISAEEANRGDGAEDPAYFQEHASILSHLPEHIDDGARVFIMIYSPDLKQHPLSSSPTSQPGTSLASSYSHIGMEDGQDVPASTDPVQTPQSGSRMFNALYAQAQALVEKPTMIMPFTSPGGYVHLLRHISPEVVYVQVTLSGDKGDAVKHIAGWVGQVVLVVGDEGTGGLADSEDERGNGAERISSKWWQEDSSIGLGKGIEVVEGMRMGEDWRRRVRGHD